MNAKRHALTVGKYSFAGGYPTAQTVQRTYDEADLNRAVLAYRFFYPTVSIMGTWKGNLKGGEDPNKVFALLEGTPQQLFFTPNSDTPYAGLPLDLSTGPNRYRRAARTRDERGQ